MKHIVKPNQFHFLKFYFKTVPVGRSCTRKQYLEFVRGINRRVDANGLISENYADTVRCYLTRAGYLKSVGRGQYVKTKRLPSNLTLEKLYYQAYPHKKKPSLCSDYSYDAECI